jgi:hypothetical protein
MKKVVQTQDPERLRRMYDGQRRSVGAIIVSIGENIADGFIADVKMEIRTNDCELWTIEITTPHNPPLFPDRDNPNYKSVEQIMDEV